MPAPARPTARLAIECSKGTYVRSLVADLGADVGCGAHLVELRRTRSGRFAIEQAVALAELAGPGSNPAAFDPARRVSLVEATGLPIVRAGADVRGPILSGVQLALPAVGAEDLEQFQIVDEQGRLLAVAHGERGRVVYDRVFPELAGLDPR